MKELIVKWLTSGKQYEAGVAIYLKYGKDVKLRRVFLEAETDYKRKRLEQELRNLLHSTQVQEEKKEKIVVNEVQPEKQWPDAPDDVLKSLRAQWKPLYSRMCFLCDTIYDVAKAGETDSYKEQEACKMAHEIMRLDAECDAIYEKRDYYLKHGRLPKEKEQMELAADPIGMVKQLENAKKYVRYYRGKMKEDPKNESYPAKMNHYAKIVEEYKKRLNIV